MSFLNMDVSENGVYIRYTPQIAILIGIHNVFFDDDLPTDLEVPYSQTIALTLVDRYH